MESFINAIQSGLISGALYAIMALGLTIIYGVSRVFNFGHGAAALIGGYITWMAISKWNIGYVPAIVFSMVVMFIFGWLVYRYTIGPLMKKPNWEFSTVLFMLGAGIMLENLIQQFFGPRVKPLPVFVEGALKVGYLQINWHDILLIIIVVIAVILLSWFFKTTTIGQAMRAVAQSLPGAMVVGINIDKIFCFTFGLAFVVTGLSGVLLGTKYFLNPHVGWEWMVKGFVIVCFGGLGSMSGAIYAAIILGVVEAIATLYLGARDRKSVV